MITTKRTAGIIDTPPEIDAAWLAYLASGGHPERWHAERTTPDKRELERACWEALRRRDVYCRLGDWLVGWTGPCGERRFQVARACTGLKPGTDAEYEHFRRHYGRYPA